jgi:2-oxoisovalerate dehydrogenase E1 component beta subunit
MGEDVGKVGGVFASRPGSSTSSADDRVIDTPLGGHHRNGDRHGALRSVPVPEIQFSDSFSPAYDQIARSLPSSATDRGQYPAKLVIRITPVGGGIAAGSITRSRPNRCSSTTPASRRLPRTHDAKALLASIRLIRCFLRRQRIYRAAKGEVSGGLHGATRQSRRGPRGSQVTVITRGAMLYETIEAANQAASQGVECEVLDLRTLWPLDIDTVVASVKKTGRVVVVHEAPRTCGFGGEIIALINEKAFLHLEAPPVRVTGFDTPFPYTLEMDYLPLAHRILPAIVETARY